MKAMRRAWIDFELRRLSGGGERGFHGIDLRRRYALVGPAVKPKHRSFHFRREFNWAFGPDGFLLGRIDQRAIERDPGFNVGVCCAIDPDRTSATTEAYDLRSLPIGRPHQDRKSAPHPAWN